MAQRNTQGASALKAAVADALNPVHTLQDAILQSTRVFLRADLNCPLTKENRVSDDSRITGTLPTIQLLQSKGARVILASHLGRPSPKSQTLEEMKARYSLRPVADRLAHMLGANFVGLVDDCVGPTVQAAVDKLQDGQVRNSRTHVVRIGLVAFIVHAQHLVSTAAAMCCAVSTERCTNPASVEPLKHTISCP